MDWQVDFSDCAPLLGYVEREMSKKEKVPPKIERCDLAAIFIVVAALFPYPCTLLKGFFFLRKKENKQV